MIRIETITKSKLENGLKIPRHFTAEGVDVYSTVEWEKRASVIRNPDGSLVFELRGVEVPKFWTQVATDVLAQKYFRKAGVPQFDDEGSQIFDNEGKPVLGSEKSLKQVINRLAGCWRFWGETHNYFATEEDAQAYEDEMKYMLLHQMGAPNSPQWFNTGLNWAYGITGPPQGHWYVDPETEQLTLSKDAYTRPQGHACYIQSIKDDMLNEGGIFDLVTKEARVFKYGSGTGSCFSSLRAAGEPLSGGGLSSGMMSFLKIFDRAAGAVKSGGTTRRAAKMVIVEMDHPDVEDFIDWKVVEEQKVASMVAGSRSCYKHLNAIIKIANEQNTTDYAKNEPLRKAISAAVAANVPINYIMRTLALAKQGHTTINFPIYDTHYESDAYVTVSGQNSNNSVSVPNSFIEAVGKDEIWKMTARTTGEVMKTARARDLWNKIAFAAWASADPGVQFNDTMNEWNTCANDDRIKATNPCVTGDTKVLTEDGKWIRIDKMVEKQTNILTNTGIVGPSVISGSFITGKKPVFRLTTKSGYELKLTADHPVFTVNRGFVTAAELTKDDFVLLPSGPVANIKEPEDKTFYQMLGAYLGDGYGTAPNSIQFTMHPEEERIILERFADYTAGYSRQTHQNRPAVVTRTKTSGKFNVANRSLVQKFASFVDLSRHSHEKIISDEIFALPLGYQKFVLQGLFTTDGTVANYGEKSQYVALDSTSLQLLKDVQIMLLGFGIKSKLYKNRRAGKCKSFLPDGKGGMKEYEVKEMHSLRISRSSMIQFENLIGFISGTKKAAKLRILNENIETYKDLPFDPVRSLEFISEKTVYDLTEPVTHTFVANGITIHNCSEYIFLDDTACNLASINLGKFLREDETFDVAAFRHATRLWTITLEITVLMAQLPGKNLAKGTYEYRTLGLGYANLGTVLMMSGIPYDSTNALAWCSALTAIMCGESYATSAEMAAVLGAFPAYERNKEHMLRVMRNHRRAAYNASEYEYENLTVKPVGLDASKCPEYLAEAARETWDRALMLGERFGYRNAQVTCVAPTGTIALVMSCDTTGIEPDFAIVKFKKLAGGGYFKIVNESVPKALKRLGYSEKQVEEIEKYCKGRGTLKGCPHINEESLKAKRFTDEKIRAVEKALANAVDIKFAFNKHVLGEDFCSNVLKLTKEQLNSTNLNLLKAVGFTKKQIDEANTFVCGSFMLEGAPHLKEEHLPVFDCANKCGKHGKRFIDYRAHIRMMGAAQAYISGGISKTINMPSDASVEDVKEAYMLAWKLMNKSIALYRDGSKLSQPLNISPDEDEDDTLLALLGKENEDVDETKGAKELQEAVVQKAYRKQLPKKRFGITHEARLGGHKIFVRTGEYPDGTLGEIFIDMYKEGAGYKGLMNCFAIAVSKALQYGVPLEEFVDTFTFTRFEPYGIVQGSENIKQATSIVDYVFRLLGYEYLGREDLVHVKSEPPRIQQVKMEIEAITPKIGTTKVAGKQVSITDYEKNFDDTINIEGAAKEKGAKMQGFTGEQCGNCASMKVVRAGSCGVCIDCGTTTGCS